MLEWTLCHAAKNKHNTTLPREFSQMATVSGIPQNDTSMLCVLWSFISEPRTWIGIWIQKARGREIDKKVRYIFKARNLFNKIILF